MNTKKDKSSENKKTNTKVVATDILSTSVLAYCGYKLVNNCLKKIKYEPNPYKNIPKIETV